MKILFKLLFVALIFTACEDVEPIIYNGNVEQNGTLLGFSRAAYNLEIERDATGSLDVIVNSSTASPSDRTYTVTVTISDAENAANPDTFTVPATVTIPANEYQGILTITGVDNGLVDVERRSFTITLGGLTDEMYDSNTATIFVYEVCEIFADFTGTYNVTSGPDPVVGNNKFIPDGVYEITAPTTYTRQFTATPYAPQYSQSEYDVVISFTCGATTISAEYFTTLACASHPGLFLGVEPASGGTYNPDNDSSFTVVVRANPELTCGAPAANQTYIFTKVE